MFRSLETVSNCTGKERSIGIILTLFCCRQFIIDSSYVPRVQATEIQGHTQLQENNVSFVQMSSPDRASELKACRIIAINAIRNIYVGEKLYLEYGSEYCFS